jgi:hypothetical protein
MSARLVTGAKKNNLSMDSYDAFVHFTWDTQQGEGTHHENDGGGASEHVLSAYWTVTLQVALNALVLILELDVHADVTFLAMKVISSKSLTDPADPTVVAVIDMFLGVVVPELAYVAIVDRHPSLAGGAVLGSFLDSLAVHAEHRLGLAPDNDVVAGVVVAEPAIEPSPTAVRL